VSAESEFVVRVERRGRVGVITLDDPGHRNALSHPLSDGVVAAVDELEADPAIHALLVTATPPVFSAGGYLPDLVSTERAPLRHTYRAFQRIAECALPSVAAVTGSAIGAGINLVLACDIAIAADTARFDVRFLDVGIHPGGGFTGHLQRAVGARRAAGLILLADSLDADQACAAGLVYEVVAADDTEARALELTERLAARPRPLLERTKQTLRLNLWAASEDAAFDVEHDAQAWSMAQPEFVATVESIRQRLADRSAKERDGVSQ
jgi:enoyl-CoA hydratase